MEYIQTILFQIPASRLEEASAADGLLSELDQHREFLRNQVGFRDLRITRSINNEGNILVVVETRWTDDGSLVRYETNEPNAAAIVRKHRGILVSDSLQVLDMEALRTESSWKPAEQADKAREACRPADSNPAGRAGVRAADDLRPLTHLPADSGRQRNCSGGLTRSLSCSSRSTWRTTRASGSADRRHSRHRRDRACRRHDLGRRLEGQRDGSGGNAAPQRRRLPSKGIPPGAAARRSIWLPS